jgi:hypothetical protein
VCEKPFCLFLPWYRKTSGKVIRKESPKIWIHRAFWLEFSLSACWWKTIMSQEWRCILVIPALGRLRQEDLGFEANQEYTGRPHLKKKKRTLWFPLGVSWLSRNVLQIKMLISKLAGKRTGDELCILCLCGWVCVGIHAPWNPALIDLEVVCVAIGN